MTWVVLATEDELSQQVGIRLIGEVGLEVGQSLGLQGFGYLKSRVKNFCQMANQHPVLLITDLDRKGCASELIREWMGQSVRPENFIFRVAVREIEAWMLADHEGLRDLIGNKGVLPNSPDDLFDPKRTLLEIAKRAPRAVKEDLLPQKGSIASQGIGYNARLVPWVSETWQPERAANRSPSLARARLRLQELSRRVLA